MKDIAGRVIVISCKGEGNFTRVFSTKRTEEIVKNLFKTKEIVEIEPFNYQVDTINIFKKMMETSAK